MTSQKYRAITFKQSHGIPSNKEEVKTMSTRIRTFLFVCFLLTVFTCFDTYSSNAQKENNTSSATAKASPTPKSKTKKSRKQKSRKKPSETIIIKPPRVGLFSSSNVVYLPCDDGNYSSECVNNDNQVIDIAAYATHPDGDSVVYNYQVSNGKIVGSGGNVKWDLSGVQEGKYEISVSVDYGKGLVITTKKEVEVVKCQCKPTQTSLDSIRDNQITSSPIPNSSPSENDCKHGFIIGSVILGCNQNRGINVITNAPPTLQSWLSSSFVYLPCDIKENRSFYLNNIYSIDITSYATDPDGDTLLYTYSVTGGKIVGSGKNVKWDLSDAASGKYAITVEVDDGHGAVIQEQKEIEVVKCN